MRIYLTAGLLFVSSIAGADSSVSGTVKVSETSGTAVPNAEIVVYVVPQPGQPDAAKKPGPPQQVQIEQKNRTFIPDLVALTVNDTVVFPNRDPGYHNVFSPKPKFDLGTLKKGEGADKPQKFDKLGVVDVYCNIHPEMAATVLVLPNRHHTHTSSGKFELKGVPPGKWKLFAYTRRAKPVGVDIEVPATGAPVVKDLALVRGAEPPHPDKYGGKYSGKGYP
jgi:plastocyanin